MIHYTPLFVFIIWLILVVILIKKYNKIPQYILNKHGKPTNYFVGYMANKYGFVNGIGYVQIAVYQNYIVIIKANTEYIIKKDFTKYKIYGSLVSMFEIEMDNSEKFYIQIYKFQAKILKDFFNIY